MNIITLSGFIGAKIATRHVNVYREVSCGCVCDLLSRVLARGREGMAWITVQTHMNVVAIAALHGMSCVIIPEGISMEQDVIDKADEKGVAVLLSGLTAYDICARMHEGGVSAQT